MGSRAEQISVPLPSAPGAGEDPKVNGTEARKDGSRSRSPSSSNPNVGGGGSKMDV